MCVGLKNQDAKNVHFFAAEPHEFVFSDSLGTTRFICELTEYRTTKEGDGWDVFLMYRSAGAVGYPLLALAVVVEWAVRTAFSLLVFLPTVFYTPFDGGKKLGTVLVNLPSDAIVSIDLVLRCFKGFVKNFYEHEFDFQSLALAQCCYSEEFMRAAEAIVK